MASPRTYYRLIPLTLVVAASLACNAFNQAIGRTPIPGPGTLIPGPTATSAMPPTRSPEPGGAATEPGEGAAEPQETPPLVNEPGNGLARLPGGEPISLIVIDMLDEANGWGLAVGQTEPSDHVVRTADGGNTWRDVTPPEPPADVPGNPGSEAAAFFLDAERAWAAYAARDGGPAPATVRVWRTADGGQSWAASQPLELGEVEFYAPSDLWFVDAQTGWLMAHAGAGMNHDYVLLFATTDGGQTWQRIADPSTNNLQMSCTKSGMGFLSAQTGWVTGDCFGVQPGVYLQRTDDGGLTWRQEPLPAPAEDPDVLTRQTVACGTYSLQLLPPQTVMLAMPCQDLETGTIDHYLYSSTDGGQSWQVASAPGRSLDFLNAQLGWTHEEVDVNTPDAPRFLLQTQDGGQSWVELSTVAWSAQMDFVSAALGWAVAQAGENLALVHTTDGGRNWLLLNPTIGA